MRVIWHIKNHVKKSIIIHQNQGETSAMRSTSLVLAITTIALCIVRVCSFSISIHISRNREFGAFRTIFRNNHKMPSHYLPDSYYHNAISSAAAASTDTCTDMTSVICTSPVKTKRTFMRSILKSLYHSQKKN